jgi:hypothetical protein
MPVWAVLIGLSAFACEAASPKAAEDWQSIELARSDMVTVRLLVKKQASAADECWMKFEYENTTGGDVIVINPGYQMDYEAFDLATGKPLRSGSLASGSALDLSLEASRGTPFPTVRLRPGKYEVGEQPSSYSTALLGVPPKTGMKIKAVVSFRMGLPDEGRSRSPRQGTKFEFNWLYPDDASIEAMRQRLKGMLARPQKYYHQTYLLEALLKFPRVGDALDVGEVLQGLQIRKGAVDGRQSILGYINARRASEPQVREFFLRALLRSDSSLLEDLAGFAPNVWDDRFVGPLVQICEKAKYSRNLGYALACLDRHSDGWRDDGITPALLSRAVMRLSPTVVKQPEDLNEQNGLYWEGLARSLAMTRDRQAIPSIRLFLDSHVVVRRFDWNPASPSPVPARACDIAYNAIQKILGHQDKQIDFQEWARTPHMVRRSSPEETAEVEKELARRDEIIRALRDSLDAQ